jgi:UDP-N-acetylmuramoyl-L-alanyl-D-glutamate--2,6-diaminopimelate ligase
MLFVSLPDAQSGGVAVVNIMDSTHSLIVKDCRARVLRCALDTPLAVRGGGTAPDSLCTAKVTATGAGWTDVEFTGPWGHQSCRVPLMGEFNVMNALQALATVHAVFGGTGEDDFSFSIIAEALSHCAAPPGRMEPVTADDAPFTVLVDYAHTDDALKNILTAVRESMRQRAERRGAGELWCVFGCGGDRDRTKRPRMGKVASELADRVIITSDNPRTESPDTIISEIMNGIAPELRPRVQIEPDRERAIQLAVRGAQPGDVVVLAGKGHETYQILPDPRKPGMTVTRDFDDREVSGAALTSRGIARREPHPKRGKQAEEGDGDEGSPAGSVVADMRVRARAAGGR